MLFYIGELDIILIDCPLTLPDKEGRILDRIDIDPYISVLGACAVITVIADAPYIFVVLCVKFKSVSISLLGSPVDDNA